MQCSVSDITESTTKQVKIKVNAKSFCVFVEIILHFRR